MISEFLKVDSNFVSRDVDRAHRTGRTFSSDGKYFSSIIVRFTSWNSRNAIYEKRSKLPFSVKADLTHRREEILQYARHQLENDSETAKLIDYVFPDRNCKISCKTKDKRVLSFSSKEEFDRTVAYVADSQPPYEAIWRALGQDRADDGANIINVKGRDVKEWLNNAPGNIYIGHQLSKNGSINVPKSKWDIPQYIKDNAQDRETTLRMYEDHVTNTPDLFNDLSSIRNKRLGCFCAPEKCHGEVLHKLVGNLILYSD